MSEALPLLYLHGLSTSDFGPALEQFRLRRRVVGHHHHPPDRAMARRGRAFAARDLSDSDYVYLWVDGIHLKVRLDQEKLCLLVMLGVRADGRKELVRDHRRLSGIHRIVGLICCATANVGDDRPGAGGR